MEVDKTKLTELLVAMCHRAMVIDDNIICSDIYNKQCHAYLGERYGKCPSDCPHLEEAAAHAHCKRGDCPKIKKLLKQLKKNDYHR